MEKPKSYFHLHLVSDATGETLITAARAVAAQFPSTGAIEHVYPLIRSRDQLEQVITKIDAEPGIVLHTIIDPELGALMRAECRRLGTPEVSVLDPIFQTFQSYLGVTSQEKIGAQHTLDREYFQRIEALNFTMAHDDGALPDDIEQADVVLIGISRTSKTPTSIYLANRGIKTANIPLVPGTGISQAVVTARRPLIVALIATTDRIYHVRLNRLLGLTGAGTGDAYTDRASIAEELALTRQLCKRHNWPIIDVTRKSIEETAAAVIKLRDEHLQRLQPGFDAEPEPAS